MIEIISVPLNDIHIGDYVCHISNENLVKLFVKEPERLSCKIPLVSRRDNKYYIVSDFEVLTALQKLKYTDTHVRIVEFESLDDEIAKYKKINADSIPSVVNSIKNDLNNMSDDYSFIDVVCEKAVYSRKMINYFFDMLWEHIPDKYLYQTYKDIFEDAAQWFYSRLCDDDIVSKIHTLNKHDTVKNAVLQSLLDDDGYLTIYHGHCKPNMKNSHSWTLNPTIAHFFGCRNASRNNIDDYYVVTGKVKLDDIIAYITQREENEIVVLNKNVKKKRKEYFKLSETNGKYSSLNTDFNNT